MTSPRPLVALLFMVAACQGELRFDEGYRECTTDRPCRLPGLRCHVPTNTCVECLASTECPAARPVCEAELHRCVECPGPTSCQGEGLRLCDLGTHSCLVTCDDGRCRDGSSGRCTSAHGLCRACDLDEDCTASASGPLCQTNVGRCVRCLGDGDCTGRTGRCDSIEGRCVECLSGTNCSLAAPFCDPATHVCRVS